MAGLRDWVTVPRKLDMSPSEWGNFVSRWNAWMETLRACVTDLSTRLTALEAGGSVAYADYTPTYTGFTYSAVTARWRNNGGSIEVRFQGTVASVVSVPNGEFVTFSLPAAAHASLVGQTGSMNGSVWGVDITSDLRYEGVARFDTATVMSIRYPNYTNSASTAWHSNSPSQPHAWAVGDTINFSLSYEAA